MSQGFRFYSVSRLASNTTCVFHHTLSRTSISIGFDVETE